VMVLFRLILLWVSHHLNWALHSSFPLKTCSHSAYTFVLMAELISYMCFAVHSSYGSSFLSL
jgi:hypothetical protein